MIELPISVVVLAAGKGTRLGRLRLAHSKAMTPVLGVPVIERVMEGFAKNGCREFVVVAAPEDEPLQRWAEDYRKRGRRIEIAFQEERKGTAHALMMARTRVHQDFALTSCDNLYPDQHLANILAAHLASRPPAVITVASFSPPDLDRSAGVRLSGDRVEEIKEKPGRRSQGWDAISKFLFVFRKDFLDCLDAVRPSSRGELELQDAITMFMEICDEPCRAVRVSRFLHLTSKEDLIEIHRHYLARHRPFIIHQEARVGHDVIMRHPVMVDRGAVIEQGAVIGPDVYVGEGARVGKEARIEAAVLYPGAEVPSGSRVKMEVFLPRSGAKRTAAPDKNLSRLDRKP